MKIKLNLHEFILTVPIVLIGLAIIWWQAGGWVAFGVLLVAFAAGAHVNYE